MMIYNSKNTAPLIALALSFPSIALRVGDQLDRYGLIEGGFDTSAFKALLDSSSTGERGAAAFVLHVWNGRLNAFDLYETLPEWDPAHLAAWAAWGADPFFY